MPTWPHWCEWRCGRRNNVSEKMFPWPPAGIMSLGIVFLETYASHGVRRAGFSQTVDASARWCWSMVGLCGNLAKSASEHGVSTEAVSNRVAEITHASPIALVRARVWRIMTSSARRSQKRRAFSDIINCSAREYDTLPTINNDGDHCENQAGGCQNSTTCPVEYSSVGLKTDGAEPSVMVWRVGSVLFRERWALGARDEFGPMDSGLVIPSLLSIKWPEGARAAPDGICCRPRGAGGSESVLLDETCDSSAVSEIIVWLIGPEVVKSPLACRAVSL